MIGKFLKLSSNAPASLHISSWIYLIIAILTITDAFWPSRQLVLLTSALIMVFLSLEFSKIQKLQKTAGFVLFLIGIFSASQSDQWSATILDGFERSRIFLLLFFAVLWLQYPVAKSPSLQSVRRTIVSQPPGRRFLFLTLGVHFLGSTLNLAGLSLLSTIVEESKDPRLRKRLSVALIQGFSCASCWSPFYVGVVVVLFSLPELRWSDVAPAAMLLAVALMLTSWLYDRCVYRRRESAQSPVTEHVLENKAMVSACSILFSLIGLTIGLVEFAQVTIPVALGLIAPPFSILWYCSSSKNFRQVTFRTQELVSHTMRFIPTLRNETTIFVAANVLGVGVASIAPSEEIGSYVNALIPWPDAKIAAMCATFILCGMIGLHPVIVVILISAIIPPESIGLSNWIVGLIYLGTWGLSTMVSPFSATTLFMSRAAGVAPHVIGWRWMSPVAILGGIVVSSMIIGFHYLVPG